jgi:hypothetical protein
MFEQAERLADAMAAPLERGRVALYRCLAQLQRGDADNDMARRDLEAAGQAFERFEAPALTRLVERAHSRAVVSRHIN